MEVSFSLGTVEQQHISHKPLVDLAGVVPKFLNLRRGAWVVCIVGVCESNTYESISDISTNEELVIQPWQL